MKKKSTSPALVIEGGAQDADLRYVSGFTAPDPVVLLADGRRSDLVVSVLEYGRAQASGRVTQVWTPQQLKLTSPKSSRLSEWALALLKQRGIRAVRVASTFPLGVADQLRQQRIAVTVDEAGLFPGRRRKRAEEIEMIAATQRTAVRAMKLAVRMIHTADIDDRGYLRSAAGRLTSELVRRAIDRLLCDRDCVAGDVIVAGGVHGADPHECGHGPLKAGQPVVIDIFPRHKLTGYYGDITRTVWRGRPAPEVVRMHAAVRAAHRAALAEVRAGVTVKRVHQAAQRTLLEHGFETTVKNGWGEGFIHSTGHGVGLQIHEAPSIGLARTRLLAGDVITVEPGLYYKRWGGIRIEDTVAVTREGYRLLADCPYR
jgi:Xaa-Pro aminopeptidase